MDGNNMNPMGPDPNLMYGQPQPMQSDFGGQPQPMQPDFGGQPQPMQPDFGGQPQPMQPDFGGQPQGVQPGFGGQPQPMQPDFGGQPQPMQQGFGGQPQAAQPGFGGQPQPMQPDFGAQPQPMQQDFGAQPGMVYQDPGYGQQPPVGEQLGFGAQPGGPNPPKSGGSKTGLIIGIIAGAVVLLGIICAVLFVRSRNIKGAEEVSVKFMNAFSELDFPTMVECIPDELKDDDAFEFLNDEETESSLALLKGFGFKIDDIEVKESRRIDPKQLTKDFNADHGTKMKFSNAAEVDVKGTMSVSFLGESQEEEMDYTFTCGKSKGKWYIVNLDDHGEGVLNEDIAEEEPTTEKEVDKEEPTTEEEEASDDEADQESSDDDEIESITDILDKNTCPSKIAEVPAGVEDDPSSMSFALDGKVFKLPQNVSELSSDWVLDDESFTKGDEELDPDEIASVYRYKNSNYDDSFYLYICTGNPTDTAVAYGDSQIRSFDADINFLVDGGEYPEVVLPKGITWGSSLQDVYDAYGDADFISKYGDDAIYLGYNFDNGDDLYLNLDLEKGVTEIEYACWSWMYD